ncbi:MAG TPA: hypothetical protein DHN29_03275 [Cytophagales bacterium]|nr:hypothetical protein [Cytophagales bacterium]|tara:strand:- start:1914 stop:2996 length:1083 start_codon:yes stop_codon:yes gene_type:complete
MYNKQTIAVLEVGASENNTTPLANTTTYRLDATSDEFAIIFMADKDMTVDQVVINADAGAGAPTYQVSIQGVDFDGDPDGTIKGGGSPASTDWAVSGLGLNWVTLDNSYSVSRGDLIAIVIEDGTTGTNPDGSNYIDILVQNAQFIHDGIPYNVISTDTGSTWGGTVQERPMFGLRNSSSTDDVMGFPIDNVFQFPSSFPTATGNISAQKFKLDAALGKRVQLCGVHCMAAIATTLFEIGIWDSTGTEIIAVASDDDQKVTTSTMDQLVYFANTWINTNQTYYVGIKQTEAGSGVLLHIQDALTDDNLSAWPGYPNNNSAYWNGSSWADNTGEISLGVNLLVCGWDKTTDGIQHLEQGFV